MHVAHLAWEHPPRLFGGLGRHVEGLTAALAAQRVDVTVVTPHLEGAEGGPVAGVEVLRAVPPPAALPEDRWIAAVLDANRAMAAVAGDRWVAAAESPDLLHVHDWMAWPAAEVLAGRFDLPLVATVHATERGRHMGHLPPGPSAWIDGQERQMVAAAARLMVCSRHMRDAVVASLDAPRDRVDVVGNGVDVSRWNVEGVAREDDLVVFAGRLEHEKGVDLLLDATADLPVRVAIAGDGTAAAALRERATTAGGAATAAPRRDRPARRRAVEFLGRLPQPELARLLHRATVVVVPSRYEPFGLAAVEALACGAPIIAADVGGLPEAIGNAGVLVPPDDVAALRFAILDVLASAPARSGEEDDVHALPTWGDVAARTSASYDAALAAGPAAAARLAPR